MVLSRATDRLDSRGTIPSRDRMGRRVGIMMIGGGAVVGLWRCVWLVWHAVVVWMLVCCSERWVDAKRWILGSGIEGKGNTGRGVLDMNTMGMGVLTMVHSHLGKQHTVYIRHGVLVDWRAGWTCHFGSMMDVL